jgi:hypothetical protein
MSIILEKYTVVIRRAFVRPLQHETMEQIGEINKKFLVRISDPSSLIHCL